MKSKPTTMVAVIATLALTTACHDSGSGPSAEELTGTWHASKIEFTSAADPSTTVEVVASGGSATLTLAQGGSCTFVLTLPGDATRNLTGTWSSSVNVLTLNLDSGEFTIQYQFDMSLTSGALTLAGAHAEFAFDDVLEEARLTLRMTR